MDKFLDKLSVTAIILLHLFVCGSLYIIGYWTTFDFDVTNYIEVLDIPKSFLLPLSISIGVSFINIIAQTMVKQEPVQFKDQATKEKFQNSLFYKLITSETFIAVLFILIGLILKLLASEVAFYGFVCLFLMLYGLIKFQQIPIIYTLFPSRTLRIFAAYLIVVLPIFSYLTGKLRALAVYNNEQYNYVSNIQFEATGKDSSLLNKKLMGKLGQSILLTDSANQVIQVVNLGSIRNIEFKKKTQIKWK